jgi:diadenosine tetraphosphate (Ap4A) HIT family hydrolase
MAKSGTSTHELTQAFAHMLPGAGDAILYGASTLDLASLRQQSVFTLNCLATAATVRSSGPDRDLQVIDRRIDGRQLPLPSALFSGAWVRFTGPTDDAVVRELLRVLVPGGLMALIAPAHPDTSRESQYSSIAGENWTPNILGVLPLAESGGLEATLIVRPNDSGPAVPMDCDFCPPKRFVLNKRAGLPGAAGTIWGDREFLLVPDVSPIFPGHLLLLTTRHYLSIGAVPEEHYELFEDHVFRIDQMMRTAFGKPAIFIEHGATQPHEAGSCIDHAHWHCLPDSGQIMRDLAAMGMEGSVGKLQRAKELYNNHESYFLARDHVEQLFFPATGLPCQFIRLVAAAGRNIADPRWQNTLASTDNDAHFGETLWRTLSYTDSIVQDITSGPLVASLQVILASTQEVIDG